MRAFAACVVTAVVVAWPVLAPAQNDENASGERVTQDRMEAAKAFQKACDAGLRGACTFLGLAYASGDGVAQDKVKAARLYRKACAAGMGDGCLNLGAAYAKGDGVPQNKTRAAHFFRRACVAGVTDACGRIRHPQMTSEATRGDKARGATFYASTCDAGDATACLKLGNAYDAGEGVPQDKMKAAQLYHRACVLGIKDACGRIQDPQIAGEAATPGTSQPLASPARDPRATQSRPRVDSCESGHWIAAVEGDGKIIKIEDGSLWQVDDVDTVTTSIWLPFSDVLVCDGKMVNVDDGESAAVAPISAIPRGRGTTPAVTAGYVIEASANDETFLVNGQVFKAQTYCFGFEKGDRVRFLSGSPLGACASATILNLRSGQACEVWCE